MITLNYCISGSSIGDLSPKLSYHVAAGSVAMEWSGKGTGPKNDWAFLGVLEDFNCIIQALSDIQAEKASASSDNDKLKTLADNHPELDGSYQNIWILYEKQGDLDQSLEYYNKLLDIRLSTVGANNADVVGGSYYGMARAYHVKGNTEKALECYNKSLPFMTSAHDVHDPRVEYTINVINQLQQQW